MVDSTARCELLSFLDCYSGYHQISLKEDDQNKTSFITSFGAYCYTTVSFGLKNARATYQWAIQQCVDDLVEAYVDDVVIKTRDATTLIGNLDRTFKALNKYKWKLNPKKCIFRVPFSILLGNVISRDGIRPNISKVKSVLDMRPSKNIKDVQKLIGCMAALSRVISQLGEKGLPFFKLLSRGVWSKLGISASSGLRSQLSRTFWKANKEVYQSFRIESYLALS